MALPDLPFATAVLPDEIEVALSKHFLVTELRICSANLCLVGISHVRPGTNTENHRHNFAKQRSGTRVTFYRAEALPLSGSAKRVPRKKIAPFGKLSFVSHPTSSLLFVLYVVVFGMHRN